MPIKSRLILKNRFLIIPPKLNQPVSSLQLLFNNCPVAITDAVNPKVSRKTQSWILVFNLTI